jgi:hypothetical protein
VGKLALQISLEKIIHQSGLTLNIRFGSFADLKSARSKVRFSDLLLIFVPHVKLEFLPLVGRPPMPDLDGHPKNF